MRQDQLQRLKELEEKLIDIYLTEADPDLWHGANVPIEEWSKEIRGDRYWCKKNGIATIALAIRTNSLLEMAQTGKPNRGDSEQDAELEKEVKNAERDAALLIKKLTDKDAKKRFDEKVHGKT